MTYCVQLPDGSRKIVEDNTTPADVAASIGAGLAKAALVARVNGDLWDLTRPFEEDSTLEILTLKSAEALELLRHDYAHVLAEAVQELYPGTQVTIGPAIETGFYYDFAPKHPFTQDDLPKIEEKMREIIQRNEALVREVWDRNEAVSHFKSIGELYKAELIESITQDEPVTIYRQGQWMDLCRGPHLPSTGKLPLHAFKLTKVAGAYWRGDHRNAMLSRIYGAAFRTKKELNQWLHQQEEAEKRDHRRLGRDLNLFHLQEEAHGSVFWHPDGWIMWQQLEQYMRRKLSTSGYVEVRTPQIYASKFWVTSGHWDKFRANMFILPDEIPQTEDDQPLLSGKDVDYLALKPMNCPGHIQIFSQGIKSYRDLPIRMTEFGCCHRNEPHGALHGLMRVRQFTQDDAHIFCRKDQLIDESIAFCRLLDQVYQDLGFDHFGVRLATRPDVRAGSDAIWDKAEEDLKAAVEAAGYDYEVVPGEGAFYGPKLEFNLRDAIGRVWQCGTLQLDFVLPERFDMGYIDQDGSRQQPVMLHRAILGSFERFIAIMIEHYAARMPLWLAPRQAVVATIVSDADEYARSVAEKLKAIGLRAEVDLRNETINYKVREHSRAKVPWLLVVGKREAQENTVALRVLGADKRQEVLTLDQAIDRMAKQAFPPDLRSES